MKFRASEAHAKDIPVMAFKQTTFLDTGHRCCECSSSVRCNRYWFCHRIKLLAWTPSCTLYKHGHHLLRQLTHWENSEERVYIWTSFKWLFLQESAPRCSEVKKRRVLTIYWNIWVTSPFKAIVVWGVQENKVGIELNVPSCLPRDRWSLEYGCMDTALNCVVMPTETAQKRNGSCSGMNI